MGQCVLRDCGFKFERPDREADIEKFLMKKAAIRFPFHHKLDEDDDDLAERELGPEVVIQKETLLRYRPATMVDREVQTIPVELKPEDYNYYKDDINRRKGSTYSDENQAIGSSNDLSAQGKKERALRDDQMKDFLKPNKFLTEGQRQNSRKPTKSPQGEGTESNKGFGLSGAEDGTSEYGNGSGIGIRVESEYDDNQFKYGIFENGGNRNQRRQMTDSRLKEESPSNDHAFESSTKRDNDDDLFKSELSGGESSTRGGDKTFKFAKTGPERVEEDDDDAPRLITQKKQTFGGVVAQNKFRVSPDNNGTSDDENLFKGEIYQNRNQKGRGRIAEQESNDLDDDIDKDNGTSSRDINNLGLKTTLTAAAEGNEKGRGNLAKNKISEHEEEKDKKGFKLKLAVETHEDNLESKSRSHGVGDQRGQNTKFNEEETNKSKTGGVPNANMPKAFDNEFFRTDLLKFMRARSPSPMNSQVRILPDDMSDEDDLPIINNRFKGKK